jgi:hypothetical protein
MYAKMVGVRKTKYPIFRFSELFNNDDCGEERLRSLKNSQGNS